MNTFFIAQVGRTVGLWGDLKFHIHSDFPEQFQVGQSYQTPHGELTIIDINFTRGLVKFRGYESIESAKRLTNTKLFADEKSTKAGCPLKEGEHFWFDIIGCQVEQEGDILGVVEDIQRMADTDYLLIKTDTILVEEGLSKTFLVPYIERYVLKSDIDAKMIFTQDAKDILLAS